ncbi:hypothetical protein N1030_03675 [Desulfovibrio mangrovi]|uniref:hypothetical protein n=1 Tax=Desulfovibrio mangrovi TaxID=2976983 RepID=UPI0022450FCF|nr:hypothetical protein [Desulfovibrio mangrovi]UZP68088.1 hypothetical protein N1030_03675 [Desulfovibrio mangrovi]
MNMWTRLVSLVVCLAMVVQLTACGMILYPERKGQRAGRIDPGVAILDGIGLFFFIIPGVIAFAVDFGTGAIYLPGTRSADAGLQPETTVVQVDPMLLNEDYIEAVVTSHTGKQVDLGAEGVVMRELRSPVALAVAMR